MLNRRIRELVELARGIDPKAEVQMLEPFEGEDAVLELRVAPKSQAKFMKRCLSDQPKSGGMMGLKLLFWCTRKSLRL